MTPWHFLFLKNGQKSIFVSFSKLAYFWTPRKGELIIFKTYKNE